MHLWTVSVSHHSIPMHRKKILEEVVIVHGGEFGATKFAKYGNLTCWVYNSRHLPVPLLSFLCLVYMRFYGIKWPPSFLYIRAGSSVLNPHPLAACGELGIHLCLLSILFFSLSFFCCALLSWPIILFSFNPFEVFRSSAKMDFFPLWQPWLHFFRKLCSHSSGTGSSC